MPRLSKLLEKIEDLAANRWGSWYERNKARVPLYAVLGGLGWSFYGMLLNSLKLGKESVFHISGQEVTSIWVFNPFKNLFVVFTPFGHDSCDRPFDLPAHKEGLQMVFRLSFYP